MAEELLDEPYQRICLIHYHEIGLKDTIAVRLKIAC